MEARLQAQQLYDQHFDLNACIEKNQYSTDLDYLLMQLGIGLYEIDMRQLFPNNPRANQDVSACIINKEDNIMLFINEEESLVRQRFSVAHELGHLVLGHLSSEKAMDICFRNDDSSKGSIKKEIDANKFASTLLMPTELVKRVYTLGYTVLEMAQIFTVSKKAMMYRLDSLGLDY